MKQAVSLDDLMLFHQVLSAGTMSGAAERLGVAKSTISRTIERLELQMGTQLLKRNSRVLMPTDIGRDVFSRCETIAEQFARLGDATEESRSDLQGTLRVSMPNEFGSAWLGQAIAEFAIRYPDLRLEIDVNSGVVDLVRDSYDIAIHLGPLASSQLTYRRMATLERGLYASPMYIARTGTVTLPQALDHRTFVLTQVLRKEGALRLRCGSIRQSVKPEGRVLVNSMRIARELVLGGAGIGVLPETMAERYVASGDLLRVLPEWRAPSLQAGATVLSREGIPRKTRVFLDFMAERLNQRAQPAAAS